MSEELAATEGRQLTCTTCGEDVLVHELPGPWIDPARYRCGECQQGKRQPQLELLQGGLRHERPAFDPSQATIPF